MRYDKSRVNYCKYVIHLLLPLGDALVEYGPLMRSGQYWVENFIGWIGGKCNAKTLPAKSMLYASCFAEAKRLFYREPFHTSECNYQRVSHFGGRRFLGPSREKDNANISDLNITYLFASYLVRKYDGLSAVTARGTTRSLGILKLWSRLEHNCGSDTQTVRAEIPVAEGYETVSRERRPSCFVAVEMDASETSTDVYYGKVLYFLDITLTEENPSEEYSRYNGRYQLAVIRWAERLMKGSQGQVYKTCSRESAFGAATVEDVSIIKRLIGVVEHFVPARGSRFTGSARRRKQTYFLDDFQSIDSLLSPTKLAEDGINRRLRGMERQ